MEEILREKFERSARTRTGTGLSTVGRDRPTVIGLPLGLDLADVCLRH